MTSEDIVRLIHEIAEDRLMIVSHLSTVDTCFNGNKNNNHNNNNQLEYLAVYGRASMGS